MDKFLNLWGDLKKEIIEKHCFTDLVYDRINKNLGISFSREEIEGFILSILKEMDIKYFEKIGKNFYISNHKNNIRLTINSNTFRVITAHKWRG